MALNYFKQNLIDALRNRGVFFRQVDESQYVTRCPSCGDKPDNLNTGHLYIRINPNDNYPILFNCFRCPYKGILKNEDLELLGIEDNDLKQGIYAFNKQYSKFDNKNLENKKEVSYQFELPPLYRCAKTDYINGRLGLNLSIEEMTKLKIITSFKDFLKLNEISKITCEPFVARNIQDYYVGFLSSSNTHILFRDVSGKQKFRWIKYPIYKTTEISQKHYYAIPNAVDIMSPEPLTINMAEGVMDILSVAYNLGYNRDDCLNFAVCGKYYNSMILKLIHLGLVGRNITLNIFSDNDHTYDTSVAYYRKDIGRYSPLFGSINVYYNKKSKDCGVPKDQIMLEKIKL